MRAKDIPSPGDIVRLASKQTARVVLRRWRRDDNGRYEVTLVVEPQA